DIESLVTEVVELEHNRVGLAAVHTWMLEEVLHDAAPIFVLELVGALLDPRPAKLRIGGVSGLGLGVIAVSAERLQPVGLATGPMKLGKRLDDPARRTALPSVIHRQALLHSQLLDTDTREAGGPARLPLTVL